MGFIENTVTAWHRFAQRSADADTPASGYWNLFFKSNGLNIKNAAGGVFPLGGADATELTIASGAITVTQRYHKIDTEADASSDDLDTISGGVAGQELIIRAENTGRTVVLKHGTGNVRTGGLNDIALDETFKQCHLIFDGTNWDVIGYHAYPNDLEDWQAYPDSDLKFAGQESNGELYYVRGDYMRAYGIYNATGDGGSQSESQMMIFLDSATDLTQSITGTVIEGHSMTVKVKQASGGTGHKVLLPVGCFWNGDATNRAILLNNTTDWFWAIARSATEYEVIDSNGVTYAAS